MRGGTSPDRPIEPTAGGPPVRHVLSLTVLCILGLATFADEAKKDEDTPKAAATRKKLKTKISVSFKDTRLVDAIDEIKDEIKGLSILLDTKGGVSRNQAITFSAKEKTLEEILDGMFKKNGLGYYVISNKGNAYDGSIWIKQGKERGYPLKKD
jgi:hypothetical protein